MKFKAIVFDFAGVITTADAYWQWIYEKLPDLSGAQKDYFRKISEDVDIAKISNGEFADAVGRGLGVPSENVWPNIEKRILVNQELLHTIGILKKGYKIGLLSNFTYPWIEELLKKHSLNGYFDGIVVSSKEKVIKPQPEIFYKMLAALETAPEETVFFDDKPANVAGAERTGMRAFLFTDNEKFGRDLASLGIVFKA